MVEETQSIYKKINKREYHPIDFLEKEYKNVIAVKGIDMKYNVV